ncbi:MAG TPA: DUF1385 domain-containing protein [Candidatus Atribacteria bacterium]|nr:DUF1385 domain-containing protein [Candidatus Atribacteria bacterium]
MGNPLIGGQAVIEGVMMRGKNMISVAVRRPDGDIALLKRHIVPMVQKYKILGIPFLRGTAVLVDALYLGIKALSYSANEALGEEENLSGWNMALAFILAIGMFVALFIFLPLSVAQITSKIYHNNVILFNLVEGVVRIAIFLAYIWIISLFPDIKRVFQYHGAEHKTIHAYENGDPLIPDEVKKYTTLHPRCGTSFLMVSMVIMIVLYSFLGRPSFLIRFLSRIALIPVVVGISYEFLRFSSENLKNIFVQMLIAPGLWLQKLTTKDPDSKQLEVAIEALKAVLDEEGILYRV